VKDNFGKGYGPPSSLMTEEEEEIVIIINLLEIRLCSRVQEMR
jgi:hypothetical protein